MNCIGKDSPEATGNLTPEPPADSPQPQPPEETPPAETAEDAAPSDRKAFLIETLTQYLSHIPVDTLASYLPVFAKHARSTHCQPFEWPAESERRKTPGIPLPPHGGRIAPGVKLPSFDFELDTPEGGTYSGVPTVIVQKFGAWIDRYCLDANAAVALALHYVSDLDDAAMRQQAFAEMQTLWSENTPLSRAEQIENIFCLLGDFTVAALDKFSSVVDVYGGLDANRREAVQEFAEAQLTSKAEMTAVIAKAEADKAAVEDDEEVATDEDVDHALRAWVKGMTPAEARGLRDLTLKLLTPAEAKRLLSRFGIWGVKLGANATDPEPSPPAV